MEQETRFIKVKLPGFVVYLSPDEINRLLLLDQTIFEQAVRRGKAFKRAKQARERNSKTLPAPLEAGTH